MRAMSDACGDSSLGFIEADSRSNLRMKHGGDAFRVLGHLAADQIAQGKNNRIGDFVADGGAVTLPFHQPVVMKDVRLIKITLILDDSPIVFPRSVTVTSQVTPRNLKDNL